MKTCLSFAALAMLGAGAAQAQEAEFKSCQDLSLTHSARVTACDAAFAKLPVDGLDWAKNRATALYYRSDAKTMTGDFDGAIMDADAAHAMFPDDRHYMAGQCWARGVANRELDAAKKSCDNSLALNPDDPSVMDSAGLVALRQERWTDAARHYSKAYSYDNGMVGSLYGFGLADLAMGKTEEGEMVVGKALARRASVADDFKSYGFTVEDMKAKAKPN